MLVAGNKNAVLSFDTFSVNEGRSQNGRAAKRGNYMAPEDVDNRLNERCVSAQMSDRVADSTSSLGRASLCSDITARCEKRGACLLSASALSPRALCNVFSHTQSA